MVRIDRAFLVGITVPLAEISRALLRTVPPSEVSGSRDHYNTIVPGVAQGINWCFPR